MVIIKRDYKEIISRHKSFINLENVDRPLLSVFVEKTGFASDYEETFKNIPANREVEPEDISINGCIKDIEKFISWQEEAGEDYFYPIAPCHVFIPWTESITGCPLYLKSKSICAQPFFKNWDDFKWEIELNEDNKWFNKLLEMTKVLTGYFGDKYPVTSSVHLRGPADMMSAALSPNILPLEIYDNPEKIKKFCHLCTDIFIRIAKKLNEISSQAKFGGHLTPLYGIWTQDVCQYFQDDTTGLLSPKLYKEFVLGNELKIDRSFPATIYSVHGYNMHVVDELINFPNLKIIQLHRGEPLAGNNYAEMKEIMPVFKKIQKHKKALIINFTDVDYSTDLVEEETESICKELSYNGLCIFISAKDIEDGKAKSEAAKRVFKKIKK